MHEIDDISPDAELEYCLGAAREEKQAIPGFDEVVSRRRRREPLVNARNVLVAASFVLGVFVWWGTADRAVEQVAEDPGPPQWKSDFDFEGAFAAIDHHFHSRDPRTGAPNWRTPSDTLLTMNVQQIGAKNHVE